MKNRNDGYFCIYSSDSEIFNFRPKRFIDEEVFKTSTDEWCKVRSLISNFQERYGSIVLPSDVKSMGSSCLLRIGSVENPVPVKKQKNMLYPDGRYLVSPTSISIANVSG